MPNYEGIINNFVGGDKLSIPRIITGIPPNSTLVKAWFTAKRRVKDVDSRALIQKSITAVDAPASGVIGDAGASGMGFVVFYLSPADTALLTSEKPYYYDIQVLTSEGADYIYTVEKGEITALAEVTQARS